MGDFIDCDGKPTKDTCWKIISYILEYTDEIYENLINLEEILLSRKIVY